MRNFFRIFSVLSLIIFALICSQNVAGQTAAGKARAESVKFSPAYAEVLLRRAELQSEIESLLESYTEDYPKVKESRYELGLLQKDFDKLLAQTDVSKLTQALGKLIVRRAELNTTLWALQSRLGAEHPEVKRARRKAEFFDNAVKEIMP